MLSRSCRCSSIWAGLRPTSGMGVLRYCRIARAALSLSNEPFREVLSWMILFADVTPTSALPFDWGYSADERR